MEAQGAMAGEHAAGFSGQRARSAEFDIRLLQRGDDVGDFVATVCDPQYTPRYYGATPAVLAERFLQLHFEPQVTPSPTTGAEIWAAWSGRDNLGYFVVLKKCWGTVKSSTFIVKKEFQRQGVGRAFHEIVERSFDGRSDLRKAYHTAPVREAGHFRLDLQFGYRVEGHLKDHYMQGSDELIMGRRLPGAERCVAPSHPFAAELRPGPRMSAAERHGLRIEELETATTWLAATHAPAQRAYMDWLTAPGHHRRVFTAGEGADLAGVLVLTPKRVGLLKASLTLDPGQPSQPAVEALLEATLEAARDHGARKCFLEVPHTAVQLERIAKQKGFRREATLESPYREGVDLALLSWFGGGPAS